MDKILSQKILYFQITKYLFKQNFVSSLKEINKKARPVAGGALERRKFKINF
jgi:hypothetical protein